MDTNAMDQSLGSLIVDLVEASLAADYTQVRRIGNSAARQLNSMGHLVEAKRLRAALNRRGVPLQASGYAERLPTDTRSQQPLVEEQPWPSSPIFLSEANGRVLQRFLKDTANAALLAQEGLASRPCLLLVGPPGTGKTLTASHVAAQLGRPFYVARLDSLISSLLGETAKNIRNALDFLAGRRVVLLLDELDAIGKLRDDRNELGELKRVVNTLIQGLDALDTEAVVIGATNHPQLLDPAIWRRFPYRMTLDLPDADCRASLWAHFLFSDQDTEHAATSLGKLSDGLSGSDIRELSMAARREALLSGNAIDIREIVWAMMSPAKGDHTWSQADSATPEERKQVAVALHTRHHFTQVEIAKLLKTSRQTIARYLEGADVEHRED